MESTLLSRNNIASVYMMKTKRGSVETVVSIPQGSRKFVLILSTLFGCPVKCSFCDASISYRGKLNTYELIRQFEHIVEEYSEGYIKGFEKFKVQFSRMGEPAFNMNVIKAMTYIMEKYPKLKPVISLSTICPSNCDNFFSSFNELTSFYGAGHDFQIQFSVHTTDEEQRDKLIPVKKMHFNEMAQLGIKLSRNTGKQILLNFALHDSTILNAEKLRMYFDPENFIIKLTPVNPTQKARENNIAVTETGMQWEKYRPIIESVRKHGFDIIDSPGNFLENSVHSNCGQYINTVTRNK